MTETFGWRNLNPPGPHTVWGKIGEKTILCLHNKKQQSMGNMNEIEGSERKKTDKNRKKSALGDSVTAVEDILYHSGAEYSSTQGPQQLQQHI